MELMVASTMTSILMVGFFSHLQGGIMVWRRVSETSEDRQRQWVALDRLERDLSCAIRDEQVPAPEDSVSGAAIRFGSEAAQWRTWMSAGRSPARVEWVRYVCESRDGVLGFWRLSQSPTEARAGQEPLARLLLPGCERAAFRYAVATPEAGGPSAWSDQWNRLPELPRLVEVVLQRSNGPPLRRVCAIPSGILPPRDAAGGSPE
ncbi:MAG: hypothetical protein HYY15_05265 [Candidatus Omnitrophica bacterium]|nr:hypothetical protein [Candidatus Omnitrophota bacterium]